ncbi:MAG: sigma-70 family RNA polymerase sigma factor [Clostridia bacterium]|nr:sigma-70 family RNA polymerase sigma factor [Clostridia bacterium]
MLYLYLSALTSDEDKDMFEELYLKYRQMMYSLAYKILNNSEDSEDAVHHAFVLIADNFKKIKSIPCPELKPYIVIIVRNVSINIYNRNKRKAEHNIDIENYEVPVEIEFYENIDYDNLLSSINTLPLIYREALYLRYVRELTTKEISEAIGISVEGVRKRIDRARIMLKRALEEGGDENE